MMGLISKYVCGDYGKGRACYGETEQKNRCEWLFRSQVPPAVPYPPMQNTFIIPGPLPTTLLIPSVCIPLSTLDSLLSR